MCIKNSKQCLACSKHHVSGCLIKIRGGITTISFGWCVPISPHIGTCLQDKDHIVHFWYLARKERSTRMRSRWMHLHEKASQGHVWYSSTSLSSWRSPHFYLTRVWIHFQGPCMQYIFNNYVAPSHHYNVQQGPKTLGKTYRLKTGTWQDAQRH